MSLNNIFSFKKTPDEKKRLKITLLQGCNLFSKEESKKIERLQCGITIQEVPSNKIIKKIDSDYKELNPDGSVIWNESFEFEIERSQFLVLFELFVKTYWSRAMTSQGVSHSIKWTPDQDVPIDFWTAVKNPTLNHSDSLTASLSDTEITNTGEIRVQIEKVLTKLEQDSINQGIEDRIKRICAQPIVVSFPKKDIPEGEFYEQMDLNSEGPRSKTLYESGKILGGYDLELIDNGLSDSDLPHSQTKSTSIPKIAHISLDPNNNNNNPLSNTNNTNASVSNDHNNPLSNHNNMNSKLDQNDKPVSLDHNSTIDSLPNNNPTSIPKIAHKSLDPNNNNNNPLSNTNNINASVSNDPPTVMPPIPPVLNSKSTILKSFEEELESTTEALQRHELSSEQNNAYITKKKPKNGHESQEKKVHRSNIELDPEETIGYDLELIHEKRKIYACHDDLENYNYYENPEPYEATLIPPLNKKTYTLNERFQLATQSIRQFRANITSASEKIQVNMDLIRLYQDFIYAARLYGKIIISERYLPTKLKTIKPSLIGGIAGGDKFIKNDILFKFAVNAFQLFDSDEGAMKVAGHELKGVWSIYNASIPGLYTPLVAIIDYKGFRLVACSLLPISRETQLYGSSDAGKTILKGDSTFNEKLEKAAKMLNIRSYKMNDTVIYGPQDAEGHLGRDSRHYIIDLSRIFPPVTPSKKVKGSHLFCLFRPEFLSRYPKPLCSDAYSGFIDKNQRPDVNRGIDEATQYLLNKHIPHFVAEELLPLMTKVQRKNDLRLLQLGHTLHSSGINFRYLGTIVKLVAIEKNRQTYSFRIIHNLILALLIEMTARTIKVIIQKNWRNLMKDLRLPLDAPYIQSCLNSLNLIFGSARETTNYWDTTLRNEIEKKFDISLHANGILTSGTEKKEEPFSKEFLGSLYSFRPETAMELLLERIQEMTGIVLRKNSHRFSVQETEGRPFLEEDEIIDVGERVKHQDIVSFAQGYIFKVKGFALGDSGYLEQALNKFHESLTTNPNNKFALRNIAICYFRKDILDESKKQLVDVLQNVGKLKNISGVNYLSKERQRVFVFSNLIDKAQQYFWKALKVDPCDPSTLFKYGYFLIRCGRLEEALEFHLKALEEDPNYYDCIVSLHQLLQIFKRFHQGELLRKRGHLLLEKRKMLQK